MHTDLFVVFKNDAEFQVRPKVASQPLVTHAPALGLGLGDAVVGLIVGAEVYPGMTAGEGDAHTAAVAHAVGDAIIAAGREITGVDIVRQGRKNTTCLKSTESLVLYLHII